VVTGRYLGRVFQAVGITGVAFERVGPQLIDAVLAVILVGSSFRVTFWWSAAFTALAALPAVMLPGRAARAAARKPSGAG